ncbi:unnamed protein product [Victoria cruziana]
MEAGEQQPRLPASEQGMMAGRESTYSVSLQKGAVPVSAQSPTASVQNMRLAFTSDGSAVYKPVTATSPPYQGDGSATILQQQQQPQQQQGLIGMGMAGGGPMKRKRGRPRKYGPDGTMALALTPVSSLPGGYSSSATPTSPTAKKARGRPPGSGKKQQLAALGSPGTGFVPHVITVKVGEDVASKIMSFSQQGPRAVCILSANGAISNVTLRQPATSGGTVTYEVVVGSFIADVKKTEPRASDLSVPAKISAGGAAAAGSPPSRGTLSESSGGPGSPLNQSTGACNNSQPGIPNMPWK